MGENELSVKQIEERVRLDIDAELASCSSHLEKIQCLEQLEEDTKKGLRKFREAGRLQQPCRIDRIWEAEPSKMWEYRFREGPIQCIPFVHLCAMYLNIISEKINQLGKGEEMESAEKDEKRQVAHSQNHKTDWIDDNYLSLIALYELLAKASKIRKKNYRNVAAIMSSNFLNDGETISNHGVNTAKKDYKTKKIEIMHNLIGDLDKAFDRISKESTQ